MNCRVTLHHHVAVQVNPELEAHWNKKLTQKLSLAPRDLVREGIIDRHAYLDENRKLGSWSAYHATRELHALAKEITPQYRHCAHVAILGIGLTRDWGFVPFANLLGLQVRAYDASSVACENGQKYIDWLEKKPGPFPLVQNIVEQVELGQEDLAKAIDYENTFMIYAGQFLQILSPVAKEMVMTGIGEFLRLPGRRMLFVHPFPEDNKDVEWGDTLPYSEDELTDPVRDALCKELEVTRLQQCKYFHHTYTAVRLRRKG